MNIIRLLIIALIVGLLYRLIRYLLRPRPQPEVAAKSSKGGDMVPCRACGLHIPSDEAVVGQQGHYCSEAHRRQAEEP